MSGPTPRLTKHARERCAEMGISTKVAKHIYRHADVRIPGNRDTGCLVARSDAYPDYRVVYCETADGPLIVTVDFYSLVPYVREGETFAPIGDPCGQA